MDSIKKKPVPKIYLIYLIIVALAAAYFIKTELGIDIFPKRHLLFFKQKPPGKRSLFPQKIIIYK